MPEHTIVPLLGKSNDGVWNVETYSFVTAHQGRLHVTANYGCLRPNGNNPDQNLELRVTGQATVSRHGPPWGVGSVQTLTIDQSYDLPAKAPVIVELRRMNTSADQVHWDAEVSFAG